MIVVKKRCTYYTSEKEETIVYTDNQPKNLSFMTFKIYIANV